MQALEKAKGALLRRQPEKKEAESRPSRASSATISDDILVINCSRCKFSPDPGTAECIGCMVRTMCAVGGSDRIVLRTGKDVEVSGRSGKAIKDTASIMRWSIPQDETKGRCSMCDLSREKVVKAVWDRFPSDGLGAAHATLQGKRPPGKDCEGCVMRTRRALEQIESGLKEVIGQMADASRGRYRWRGWLHGGSSG
jgi:hypothetical protein